MITRLWHGWASRANADAYENYLRSEVLPGIHRVQGYQGAYLLRREDGQEIAFVTLTFFDSLDAVRAFAGEDYELAVVPPKAQKLLSHYDARAVHYQTVLKQD